MSTKRLKIHPAGHRWFMSAARCMLPLLMAWVALPASAQNHNIYVANFGSYTVSVIDQATNTVTETLSVGLHPSGIAVSPDGATVYVAVSSEGLVYVINAATNTITGTVFTGGSP